MSRRELMNRREFIATAGAAVAAVAGGGDSPEAAAVATMGSIRGNVVDMTGASKAVGRIFLLDKGGLNKGVFTDVTPAGAFDFGEVAVGEYQLQYWGANLAHVPEPLPNPVP